MSRAFLFVLDSVGIGGAPDAEKYGDQGSATVANIAIACAKGRGDRVGLRSGPLSLPNLTGMGLGAAAAQANGSVPPGLEGPVTGVWGSAVETSNGKDTPSGHWEIAGAPVTFEWAVFPNVAPAFPAWLTEALIKETGILGILGNRHGSGSQIIQELGPGHVLTGKPICYTSADSVFQIAAHEEHFGLGRLLETCEVARKLLDPMKIGRVIARPFTGSVETGFTRTANRRDFSIEPPEKTLLDYVSGAGRNVITMGKISDIFAHRGTGDVRKAAGNMALLDSTLTAMGDLKDGGFLFANFVDFDSEFGHSRDVPGYANALEQFDARLPEVFARLAPGDLLILTADHGNDPTWRGTDHTREQVPILLRWGTETGPRAVGQRLFSDIGASIADHLDLPFGPHGTSFVNLTWDAS
ncbi:MAG: phosphopentomutase [Sulfitobacter sp.]